MKKWRRRLIVLCVTAAILCVAHLIYFPGRQSRIAFTLATGAGIRGLQARVDELEEKAITHTEFTAADKEFLRDLYECMAKGAKLTVMFRQSGEMMDRYLSCLGSDLKTAPRIFTANKLVMEKQEELRRRVWAAMKDKRPPDAEYASETFHMCHPSSPDSVFGLYYGRVLLRPVVTNGGAIAFNWRAEVPWVWPSYESLKSKYGIYHAECVPIPNLNAMIHYDLARALNIDNGLGEYLTHLGLAKSFVVFAEWQETIQSVTSR